MASEQPTQPWYSQTWVAVVALVLFFPVGVFLMWRFQRWEVWLKTIITVAAALVAFIIIIAFLTTPADDDEVVGEEATPSPPVEAATPTPEPTEPMIDPAATATAEAEDAAAATATAEAAAAAATATAEALSLGEVGTTLENDQVAVTVNSYNPTYTDPNEFITPDPGFHFEVVEVTIENKQAADTWSYNPFDFEIADSEGFRYEASFSSLEPELPSGELRPGDKVRGFITFQVSDGVTGKRLLYSPLFEVVAEWVLQ